MKRALLALLALLAGPLAWAQGPTITTASPLPEGVVGVSYTQGLQASGGVPPYMWTASGSLPAGLSLASDGLITGTPAASGTTTFTATVTDSGGASASANFSITIAPAVSITTGSLGRGTVGTPYSATLAATGGIGSYTWTVSGGALPAGLSLSTGGVISGTPTAAGTATFTAMVTAAGGGSATKDFSITIAPPVSVTTASLAAGTVGTAYSATLAAAGGVPPYTWAVSAGALPAGLSLSSGGAISGTPSAAGTATFTARATDADGRSATKGLSIAVSAPVSITTASLATGTVGTAYSATLAATGGSGSFTWAVSAGALPAGLSLSSGGAISGTPTAAGTATFTARATDTDSRSATRDFSLTIAAPVSITTASLAAGTVGTAYSASLAASGGVPPYTWAVSAGALPSGLSLSSAGAISGTPTAAGTATFTVRVTDSGSRSATKDLTIAVAVPVSITTASLAGGTAGTAYSATLAATGGAPPYTWAVSGGSLPAGLSLSSAGAITGTPTTAGTATFTARATDSAGRAATKSLTLAIAAPVSIATASLAGGTVGAAYSATLSASGGTPPFAWSVISGALPAGIALSGAAISGTPTAAGTFSFTIQVADSAGAKATRQLSIAIAAAISITTQSLPGGTVSGTYSQTLTATGGTPPLSWSVAGGSLPPGLRLSAGGVISGSPTAAGTSSFTAAVTDAAGASATRAFAIAIAPAISISAPPQISATAGTPYSFTFAASGGTPPYTWSVSAGTLPGGINLTNGVLSGSTTAVGIYDFTLRVTDTTGGAATDSVRLVVNPAPAIVTASLASGIAGIAYSQTLAGSGGTSPLTWSVSGNLPPGIALNGAQLSGTPTTAGSFPVRIVLKDVNGAAATGDFTITIGAGLSITTTSLPNATALVPYSHAVTAAGGAPPYAFAVSTGALPAGFALDPASGTIAGTSATAGTATFTIQVSDALGTKVAQPLRITVAPVLLIVTSVLPAGAISGAYSQALSAAGGTPPYIWSLDSGALPAGLTLNPSGALGGTPTQTGDFAFTVRVTDSASATATKALTIHIGTGLTITTASPLQTGTVGAVYTQALAAAGGVPPYRWSLAAGSALPPGLALDPNTGVISGVPTATGTSTLGLQVTDAAGVSASGTFVLTIASDLVIQTASLPNAATGLPYSITLAAAGGKPPYTWSLLSGGPPLPAGLSLDATGRISGIPTAAGPVSFTVVVSDAAGAQASRQLTLTVTTGLAITTSALPPGTLSAPYNQAVAVTGGAPPYTWAVTTGALPPGITLDSATGGVTGTPAAVGTFQFTVQVTDSARLTVSLAYTLVIVSASAPAVAIGGIADTGQPLAQSSVQVTLGAPYPADIAGQVTLDFASTAVVPSDDKAIAFTNGQRAIAFTIPAGQTQAKFPDGSAQALFQNGTVAGTLTVTVALQAGGAPLSPAPAPRQMKIAPAAPSIQSVKLVKTGTGFEVWTTGFATSREMTDATYTFEGAPGNSLQTPSATVQIAQPAQTWYQDPGSAQWGSQFTLVQPFTVQGGSLSAVSVALRNAQGTSAASRATF